MKFATALVATFAALAIAAPTGNAPHKRAGVLGVKTYNEIQVSSGTAGNAKAKVDALFTGLDLANAASIDKSDLDFLNQVNQVGNDAEEVFNTQIAAASGAAKVALQNGKIQNKVLKLTGTVLNLQIKAAQGTDTSAKLATEQKKLDNNIKLDQAAAGQASTAVNFDATIGA